MVLEFITDGFPWEKLALDLLKTDAYKKGEFTLSSGRKSEHYVNCKPVTLTGQGLGAIVALMLEYIDDDVAAIGGLTLGADPLVVGLAQTIWGGTGGKTAVNALIVRKKQKGYGANAWIEGKLPPKGSKVVVLEDVTTTGGSALIAVEKLRDAGYIVERIITIIDRQVDGEADAKMKDANIELISLFTLQDLIDHEINTESN
tara:strand:- start:76 stop:681 length:606 start_codon:yes stop_codon:yes gene_type:complete